MLNFQLARSSLHEVTDTLYCWFFVWADSRLLLSIQNGFDGDLVSGDESDQDGLEESPLPKKPSVQQRNLNQVVLNFSNSPFYILIKLN